jgi:hypothetical protein
VLRLKAKVVVAASMLWVLLKKYVKSPFSWPTLVSVLSVIVPNMLFGNPIPVLFGLAILLYDFRAVMALIALENTREIDYEVYGKAIDMIFDEEER